MGFIEKTLNDHPLVWAHRGASAYAPENTLPAFQLAVDMHADGVELDVHLSADGELIVCHDGSIRRTSDGEGEIAKMTLAELRKFSFNAGKEDFGFVPVPTLDEVYALLAPTGLTVNVEIKGTDPRIPALCVGQAKKYGMTDRVLYSSFDHYALVGIHAVNPRLPVAPLYSNNIVCPWLYAGILGACAIHPHYGDLQRAPAEITACHTRGIRVHYWTVDDPAVIETVAKAGCDAIITNKPDVVIDTLKSLQMY